MRKRSKIALLLALSMTVGIQSPCGTGNERYVVKAEEQQEQSDTVTSEDGLSVYHELEDGTISLVSFNGEAQDGKLTIPDMVDEKQVTALEGTLLDESTAGEMTNEIVLPKSLKEIDVVLFRNVFYLTTITIDEENKYFTTKDGILYNKDCTELLRVPQADQIDADSNEFVIPDTVVTIGNEAFFNCYGMCEITISKNVESIGELAFYRYLASDRYFSFKVVDENQYFMADEDGSLFSKDKTILYRFAYPTADSDDFFATNLVSYKIPDTVTEIGSAAFQGSVGNPNSFSLDGLLYVEFPENLKIIGNNAFDQCGYLGDEEMADYVTDIDSVDIIIPDSVTEIGTEAFLGCPFKTIVLPKGLQEIQTLAFYNCSNLEEITIPENVKKIGDSAFISCKKLSKVQLNEKLQTIDEFAFYNCTALTLVEVGKNVTEIGQYALGYTRGEEDYALVDNFTILCKQDSAAEEYAKNNGISVKYLADVSPAPSATPTTTPSAVPSATPAVTPNVTPSAMPTVAPTATPSAAPSQAPLVSPAVTPTAAPSEIPAAVKKLGKAKLVSVVNKKKNKVVVKIKKAENATGYVVQYAKSKKFKNAKSVVISKKSVQKIILKNMKKKTYYVRVRAFRKLDKGTEYSSWSTAKKVKVRK